MRWRYARLSVLQVQRNGIRDEKVQRRSDGECKTERDMAAMNQRILMLYEPKSDAALLLILYFCCCCSFFIYNGLQQQLIFF